MGEKVIYVCEVNFHQKSNNLRGSVEVMSTSPESARVFAERKFFPRMGSRLNENHQEIAMTLMDRIIDEAEQLAENRVLRYDASDAEIIGAVEEILNYRLHFNSVGARLCLASYYRVFNIVSQVDSLTTA